MKNRKNSILLIIISVVLVMSLLFGGSLFLLSSMGYVEFNGNSSDVDNVENNREQEEVQLTIDEKGAKNIVNLLYLGSLDYFDDANTYCGVADGYYTDIVDEEDSRFNGFYLSISFSSLAEIKNYLLNFVTSDLLDSRNFEDYYVEKDGKLYCADLLKGGIYSYNSSEITVEEYTDSKINATIKSRYVYDETGEVYNMYKNIKISIIKVEGEWKINGYKVDLGD